MKSNNINLKSQNMFVRFLRNVRKDKALLMLLVPGVLYLILNNYLPMFGVVIAFKHIDYSKGILGSDWVGFDNFKFLFSTKEVWIITRNTVLYNALFILLHLVIPVGFAIALNEMRVRLAVRFYQSVMFLPYFLSMIVISYLVYSLLNSEYGFINKTVLEPLGFPAVSWYSEVKYWPYILPLVNIWKSVGYYSIVYLAAIIGIDNEYYEAAHIDGASKWQQITRITIPLIRPVLIILMLLQVGKIFNADFGLFYQVPLDSGALYSATQVIDTYVYRALLTLGDIGMSSAAGLYQASVGFVLVLTTNYVVRKMDKENALF
ncbi:ABC transporter permease [Paenibacillus qinlingensis]|uniref:ABC transporter permease n=1 Tax=Paenibacillus qinlingensis TaxID=1837343 RepID=UPI001566E067|nr:ABC transporter permease subunit [Paenibacillus qinlingensis]NQX58447.1 sugar ABC transporter permease [Paenibacillus qinlingensis]